MSLTRKGGVKQAESFIEQLKEACIKEVKKEERGYRKSYSFFKKIYINTNTFWKKLLCIKEENF